MQKKEKSTGQKKTLSEHNFGTFQKGKQVTTVYMSNLQYSKNEQDVKKMFAKFGEVSYVRLMLDPKTQKSKGFAFVQMPNKIHANRAIQFYDGRQVSGRTLKASIAQDNLAVETKPFVPQKPKVPLAAPLEARAKTAKNKKSRGLAELFDYLQR